MKKTGSLWKQAVGKTIISRRAHKAAESFIHKTQHTVTRSDSGMRADLERMETALRNGDVAKLHKLEQEGRVSSWDLELDQIHGLCAIHIAATAVGRNPTSNARNHKASV